jgi:hypothetical protein
MESEFSKATQALVEWDDCDMLLRVSGHKCHTRSDAGRDCKAADLACAYMT